MQALLLLLLLLLLLYHVSKRLYHTVYDCCLYEDHATVSTVPSVLGVTAVSSAGVSLVAVLCCCCCCDCACSLHTVIAHTMYISMYIRLLADA
jgi:hypothetical protein